MTRRPLSVAAAARELAVPGLGGMVLFTGRVRGERNHGGYVVALDYEVHEDPALRVLRELDLTVRRKFGVERTVLWHRVGRVKAGEVSVIVGAAAGHRAPAFAAARYLIDELKRTVPIWKTDRARSARPRRRPPHPRAARSSD
ncbi:MAG: molybdenum cofactor biosynthesis protein MoaE [Thermoplasmata archaeon]|nr:molybdenum cofactor biosynthesis protein MoaE [Thermoplasmata archaeon]